METSIKVAIARDKSGKIYMYLTGAIKDEKRGMWLPRCTFDRFYRLEDTCFPKVKWEDEEPLIEDLKNVYKLIKGEIK